MIPVDSQIPKRIGYIAIVTRFGLYEVCVCVCVCISGTGVIRVKPLYTCLRVAFNVGIGPSAK